MRSTFERIVPRKLACISLIGPTEPAASRRAAGRKTPELSARTGLEARSWERVLTLAYARAVGKDRDPESGVRPRAAG